MAVDDSLDARRQQSAAAHSTAGSSNSGRDLSHELAEAFAIIRRITGAMSQTIVGQEHLVKRLITGLITEGHVLIEGVPGLAKTLSIKSLAQTVGANFKRIQFTPDLLPSDIVGTEVFRPQDGKFEVRRGPVFANFVLADEINRAPAKVQSALLETMQEKQVTIGETTFKVPDPFFVMATQNPIEQEGTYPLPEAQIDRFIMKIKVDYPTPEEERKLLSLVTTPGYGSSASVAPSASLEEVRKIRNLCQAVYADDKVRQYMVDIVWATRAPENYGLKIKHLIELGASPRASISLFLTARATALLSGEYFVVPQNVKDVALDVLRHRVVPSYEAEAEGLTSEDLIRMILEGVPVP